ncbi:MAG: arginyltransferase, partial [Archangium sp.]|nr:arginyltransferase [Archangium sp.]
CSYLPNLQAALEYRLMVDVTPGELDALLQRGWRRFGPAYFRPACAACGACVSLRLDVHRFQPTQSQRRALKRSRRFRLELNRPSLDQARLALHVDWHRTREDARGWEPSSLSEEEYATQFAFPSATGREVAWYDGDRLVALSLVDLTANSVSAAYFFYHPDIARLSPGVGNVMRCVELARELGCQYVYLGYRVEACASLVYKGAFQPNEALIGRPGDAEAAEWREADVTG